MWPDPIYFFVVAVLLFLSWIFSLFKVRKKENLSGKIVLVTGASSGIGRACCFALSERRCALVLCSRREEELQKVKREVEMYAEERCGFSVKVEILPLDITAVEKIENVVNKALSCFDGRVDILLNCAGMSCRGDCFSTELEVFQKLMSVNFFGQIVLTRAVLSFMTSRRSGHIVSVGSIQGKIAVPFRAPYAASKHASQAFFDSLRAEVAHLGIDVTVVNPGYVRTNLSMNAVIGDGTKYGKTDKNTEGGYDPSDVAERIVQAIERKEGEVIIAPLHHRLTIWVRCISPSLYFWIMSKRAKNR